MTYMYVTTRMSLECILLREKRITDHMLCDFIYMTCPEQANLQRQKADRQRPGAGGGKRSDC